MSARATLAIAHKELLENVLSWRFLIALVLSTLILVTSVMALGASYEEDLAAQRQRLQESARGGDATASPSLQLLRVLGEPNPLGIFVDGPGNALRREAPTGEAAGPLMTRGGGGGGLVRTAFFEASPQSDQNEVASGAESPTNRRFSPLDLGFVAVVVMTFTAVLFSHDALSGERERGTLKLMLSNAVPRDTILLGKYLGGMASLLVPFVASLVLAIAVLQVRGVQLAADEWLRLGLIALLVLPLVSAFYLLGLFVSGLVRRSSTSLLAVSLVWLVLVFGAGNVAATVAKETTEVTQDELAQRYQEIDDRYAAQREAATAEILRLQRLFDQPRDNGTDPAEAQRIQQQLQAAYAARQEIDSQVSAERGAVVAEARGRLVAQLERAERFAAVSPAEAFRSLATALSLSDYWSFKDVSEAAEEYRREVQRAREEWFASSPPPTFTGGPGGNVQVVSMTPGPFEAPTFSYEPPTVAQQLATPAATWHLVVLLAYNVLGFAAAYFAFVRVEPA